jgi:hypothetical protein
MSKIDPQDQKRAETKKTTGLPTEATYWATPKANDAEKRGNVTLRPGLPELVGQAQSWPTPRSTDGEKGGPNQQGSKGDLMLPSAAAQWPTPNAQISNDRETPASWHARAARTKEATGANNGLPLTVAATQWPTPTARDHKGGGNAVTRPDGKSRMDMLDWRAEAFSRQDQPATAGPTSSETTPNTPRRLNPIFAEWLMGWPSQWTKAEPSASSAWATALWRSTLQQHLSCLLAEPACEPQKKAA